MTVPRYVAPIRRVSAGRGHQYRDAAGQRVPGVTTIIGDGVPKPALVNWAANATADYAINHWDELAELKPAARLSKLQKARYEDRDAAANRGTRVHTLAERLVRGEEVDVPDDIAGHVESYVAFLDDWQPEPVLVEGVVMSHRNGYAGTLDLIADFPADPMAELLGLDIGEPGTVRAILDVKTSRSGIFGETALQLAAYRYADTYVNADGAEQPMYTVDVALGLHVRADGYSLLPIEAGPDQLRELLYAREVGRFTSETSKTYVGAALDGPRGTRRRRLQVSDGVTL